MSSHKWEETLIKYFTTIKSYNNEVTQNHLIISTIDRTNQNATLFR